MARGDRRGSRKVCKFCADPTLTIDYKNDKKLLRFVTERGKIVPRRISGTCARHQRRVTRAVKRTRHLGIIPFTIDQYR